MHPDPNIKRIVDLLEQIDPKAIPTIVSHLEIFQVKFPIPTKPLFRIVSNKTGTSG